MAIGISALSIAYNGAEAGVSIGFGKEKQSNALIFFGLQSIIEVASASLVMWRFAKIERPDEAGVQIAKDSLRKERFATVSIGALLGALSIGAWATSINSLVRRERPESSLPGLIISGTALGLMILIWAPKPWLAKTLNSSAMRGEAKCSLACIAMTSALLVGTLIGTAWKNGWWIDSATTIALGVFFAKDGVEMTRWGLSKDFTGSCCPTCPPIDTPALADSANNAV
jgi:predicted Co/Zn/Cd cation transporter (cation efflux family)